MEMGDTLWSYGADYFLAKYTSQGNLVWVREGGTQNLTDNGNQVQVDNQNNIYSKGWFHPSNTTYFDTYHYNYAMLGYKANFVAKYKPDVTLQWVRGVYTGNFPDIVAITSFTVLKNKSVMASGYHKSSHIVSIQGRSGLLGNVPARASGTNEYQSFAVCFD